jgi:type I site-specific restriction endonuclease
VTGLFDFKNTAEEVRERIKAAKRITDKNERLRQLAQFELDWERSDGMPQVIRKHISQDTKRVIVFCNSVKHLNTMKPTIADWFKQAGLAVADIYSICHETDRENTDQMEAFEQDTNDGVKIMLAVNMLNEGVHIPRVDAVIMLRTTASRIIYMQQLGRCLTAANTARPVVLDMVDNISNANVIGNIKDEFEALEQQDYEKDGEHKKTPRQFIITDYTQGIQKVVEKLTEGTARIIPLCERLENIERFVKEHGRLPREIEREAYRDWEILLINKDREPRVMELMEEYPRYKEESQLAAELTEFIKTHERLPTKGDDNTQRYLGKVFKAKREQWLNDYPELKEQFYKHYHWRDKTEECMQTVIGYYIKNKRMPLPKEKEKSAYQYIVRHNHLDRLNKMIDPYKPKKEVKTEPPKRRVRSIEELIEDVESFCKKHGRLPQSKDKCKASSAWLRLRYNEQHPKAFELEEKYGEAKEKWLRHLPKLEEFVKANGRMPSRKKDILYQVWRNIRKDHKDDPRVKAIRMMSRYDENGRPVGDS